MLTVIEDLLSKKEVTQFTQALDKGQWQDGKHTAGSQASKVKYNQTTAVHWQMNCGIL